MSTHCEIQFDVDCDPAVSWPSTTSDDTDDLELYDCCVREGDRVLTTFTGGLLRVLFQELCSRFTGI